MNVSLFLYGWHLQICVSYAHTAKRLMSPNPSNKAAIFRSVFRVSAISFGITSIKATYRNVPDAIAEIAAAPVPCAMSDKIYPIKIPKGDAKVNGSTMLQNLFILSIQKKYEKVSMRTSKFLGT